MNYYLVDIHRLAKAFVRERRIWNFVIKPQSRLTLPLTSFFFLIAGWWQWFLVPCKALEIRFILMDCYLVDIHKLAKAFVRDNRIWNFEIKPKYRLTLPLTSFFLIAGWWQLFLVPCKALEIRYILMDCYLVDIHKLMKAFRGYRMWNVVTRPTDGATIFAY